MNNNQPIPFLDLKKQYSQLQDKIDSRVLSILASGAYIGGPEVQQLEKALSDFTGSKYTLSCGNGTDALILPLMALGIQPGDEVITTAFSFIATAEVIHLLGAKPVYLDIEADTYNLDATLIEKAITSKTKAIMPVSLYGQTCDMDAINKVAAKHGLMVIEDAAQSFGAKFNGKNSCQLSPMAGTSFFPAKPLGCYGEGGAIFTDSETHYQTMREIRDHGSKSRYHHTRLGMNARLDTLQCGILLEKLVRYPWEIRKRQEIAEKYSKAFSEIHTKDFQYPKIKSGRESVWAQYTLSVPNREEFQKAMNEKGVPTMVHYPCIMPEQPWYKSQQQSPGSDWSRARYAAQHVVSLPLYADMPEEHIQRVIQAVTESLH
jgi:UDP-2-acetamido-2-deoxy-ribo-hexuluronate aminotransferase